MTMLLPTALAAPAQPMTPASSEAGPAPPARTSVDAVAAALRVTVLLEGDGVYGTGILVDPPRGTILTAYHVVQDMRAPKATNYAGHAGTAKLLQADESLDLAVLSAPELADPHLAPPRLADSTALAPGEEVFAVGMPRKLPFSVSRGIVAAPDREMDGQHYLQVDMNINDGNSGGPVLTDRGEIVGVMSFILRRAEGLSFASPMAEAEKAFPKYVPPLVDLDGR